MSMSMSISSLRRMWRGCEGGSEGEGECRGEGGSGSGVSVSMKVKADVC